MTGVHKKHRMASSSPVLHHACLLTSDVDTTLDFYRDMLGMEVVARACLKGSVNVAFLCDGTRSSDFYLKVLGPPFESWMKNIFEQQGPRLACYSFWVKDLHDWYESLRSENIDVVTEPAPFLTTTEMYFRDASGAIVGMTASIELERSGTGSAYMPGRKGLDYVLHHVSMICPSLEAQEKFYREALHLDTAHDNSGQGTVFMGDARLAADPSAMGPLLEIMGEKGFWDRERSLMERCGPSPDHISFLVQDVDAASRELASKQVDFQIAPMDYGDNRIAFFEDPNGVSVEIELPIWHSRLAKWRESRRSSGNPHSRQELS